MSIDTKLHKGYATEEGTTAYREYAITNGVDPSHFKEVENLFLSSIGMGSYLGNQSQVDDENIKKSLEYSVGTGSVNVIDTALNYRAMLSEKTIGKALNSLTDRGIIRRENIFICTKNGYATNDGEYQKVDLESYLKAMYIDKGIIQDKDISPSYNVMNPDYISNCINKSLCNLRIETIDLVYIHNSRESWFDQVDTNTYLEMLSKVFQVYENFRRDGKIRYYGMATWNCFTSNQNDPKYLSLWDVVSVAHKVGGPKNGFKFIQLPFNYYMKEPYLFNNQVVPDSKNQVSLLEAATRLGIHVFTSVPLFQGRLLTEQFSDESVSMIPFQSARLLQFVRSVPGIVAPLVGQKQLEHSKQNTAVSKYKLLEKNDVIRLLNL
ncbi:MAG TPA: aldo/keto reductase [Candidatus Nitrosocosmicus sp.]|nr:aldo/keto reductase [Candidatus Nitrosocosmicus sp.]